MPVDLRARDKYSQNSFSGAPQGRARTEADSANSEFSGRIVGPGFAAPRVARHGWSRGGECLDANDWSWIESGGLARKSG